MLFGGKFASFFGLAEEEQKNEYSDKKQVTNKVEGKPVVTKTESTVNRPARPSMVQSQPKMQQPRQQAVSQPTMRQQPIRQQPVQAMRSNTHQNTVRPAITTSSAMRKEYVEPMMGERKVVELQTVPKSMNNARQAKQTVGKIAIIEPRAYSETMAIAKKVIGGEAILVNFHLVDEAQAKRIIDFLTGTVYALDGDIKRVGDEIFLCTPAGLEIDSSNAENIAKSENLFDL
ncbi:MAG: cell division protein SepF [Enterococcus sp.]